MNTAQICETEVKKTEKTALFLVSRSYVYCKALFGVLYLGLAATFHQ